MPDTSRNDVLTFARRTRQNLEYIERAHHEGADVHVVTQLANSLLGLIVFLKEGQFDNQLKRKRLAELVKQGWPRIEVTKGKCHTLGDLLKHLRNAVAHRRITFSSDSPNIDAVAINAEDGPDSNSPPNWSVRIQAKDLCTFCLLLIGLLEETIG